MQRVIFSLWALPGYILFFLMLCVPYAYQPLKAVFIFIVLMIIMFELFFKRRHYIDYRIMRWTLFMVIVSLIYIGVGLINKAPGALRVGTVFVLWPILYTFYIAGAAQQSILEDLLKLLVIATLLICLYFLYFAAHEFGFLPDALYYYVEEFNVSQGQRIVFYEGYSRANLHSFSTLIFTVPFLITAVITWSNRQVDILSPRWLWLALVLGLVCIFMSGRRGIWISVGLSLPLAGFVLFLSDPRVQKHIAIVRMALYGIVILLLIGVFLTWTIGLDFSNIYSFLLESFDESRETQMQALIQGWSDNPLFGAGHGASVAHLGSVRAEGKEWMYELFYLALLYQTGLVGFTIYASGIIWIYWLGFRIIRSGDQLGLYLAPVLVGTACFLIANLTNPYIGTYDHLWVIFLPIAIINRWLLDHSSNNKVLTSKGRSFYRRSPN